LFDIVGLIDGWMAGWLPSLLRIALWAVFSGIISMGIYVLLSPQQRFLNLKAEQKEVRQRLKHYDADWDGLLLLIRKDLALSFRQLALVIVPFVCAVAPVLLLFSKLSGLYTSSYADFGPDWMRGFEFWYFLAMMVACIIIKIKYKII
jgi:hypothetical protein